MGNAVRDGDGRPAPGSNLEDLVVISGLSGAGKSSAMNVFEDAGYFCVDNLPAEMIRSLSELFMHEGSKVELRGGGLRLARRRVPGGAGGRDRPARGGRASCTASSSSPPTRRRWSTATRRPAAATRSRRTAACVDGIRAEQELLAPVRQRADIVIDTSGLSAAALRRKVADELLEPATPGRLAVTFTSFGHKHGPPRDADLAFDVRFLPNPHYDPDLRPLTGFDQRIVDYVGRDGRLEVFYSHLIPLLEFVLPQYVAEGKAHLMVAIGCTGGRHRSVAIAEHLAARSAIARSTSSRSPTATSTACRSSAERRRVELLGVEAHRGEVALDLEADVAVHPRPERHGALASGSTVSSRAIERCAAATSSGRWAS